MSQIPSHIRLISPYTAMECKKQIAVRNEDKTLWAYRNQQRTVTRTVQVDDTTYAFEIRRAPKSSLELNWGTSVVRMKGIITEKRGKTIVIAHLSTAWWMFGLVFIILMIMIPMMMLGFSESMDITQWDFMAFFGVFIGLIITFTIWSFDREKRRVYDTFMDSVGGAETRPLSEEEAVIYGVSG